MSVCMESIDIEMLHDYKDVAELECMMLMGCGGKRLDKLLDEFVSKDKLDRSAKDITALGLAYISDLQNTL